MDKLNRTSCFPPLAKTSDEKSQLENQTHGTKVENTAQLVGFRRRANTPQKKREMMGEKRKQQCPRGYSNSEKRHFLGWGVICFLQ
jgi:hypothetical protein